MENMRVLECLVLTREVLEGLQKNTGNAVKNSDDFNNALQSAKEKAEKRVEIIRNPNAKDKKKKNEAHKDLSVLVDAMDQVGFDYNEKTVTFTPRTV